MTILGLSIESWYLIIAIIIWIASMRYAASRWDDKIDAVMGTLFAAILWPVILVIGAIVSLIYGIYRLATIGVNDNSSSSCNPPSASTSIGGPAPTSTQLDEIAKLKERLKAYEDTFDA